MQVLDKMRKVEAISLNSMQTLVVFTLNALVCVSLPLNPLDTSSSGSDHPPGKHGGGFVDTRCRPCLPGP